MNMKMLLFLFELLIIIIVACTSGQRFIKCSPKEDDDVCIAYDFLQDNIINCPPPHRGDEPDRSGQAGTYVPWNYSAILALTAISCVFLN